MKEEEEDDYIQTEFPERKTHTLTYQLFIYGLTGCVSLTTVNPQADVTSF